LFGIGEVVELGCFLLGVGECVWIYIRFLQTFFGKQLIDATDVFWTFDFWFEYCFVGHRSYCTPVDVRKEWVFSKLVRISIASSDSLLWIAFQQHLEKGGSFSAEVWLHWYWFLADVP